VRGLRHSTSAQCEADPTYSYGQNHDPKAPLVQSADERRPPLPCVAEEPERVETRYGMPPCPQGRTRDIPEAGKCGKHDEISVTAMSEWNRNHGVTAPRLRHWKPSS